MRALTPERRASLGTVISAGRRVNAQVSMSRTKKSGSIAQRRTSTSRRPGSGRVPAARAACSRDEAVPLLNASISRGSDGFMWVVLIGTTSGDPVKT